MRAPDCDQLTWRPLTRDDAGLLHPLQHALDVHDGSPESHTVDDVADELAAPWLRLDEDSVVGLDGTGRPLAFGLVQVRPGDVTQLRAHCLGGVDPQARGRGIGRALLAWQVEGARHLVARRRAELGAAVPALAMIQVQEGATDGARLATRLGFGLTRWFTVMRRPLIGAGAAALPAVRVPDGLRLVPWAPDLDDAVRHAHNEAFADHWGFQPWTPESWHQWQSGHRSFRPAWSFAVLDGRDVAGYALSAAFEQDWTVLGFTEGWTAKLGVRRPWRGRGAAQALLAASMAAFAGDGMEVAGLDVDSENLTGAVALYTGLGYAPVQRTATWTLPLP